MKPLVFLLSLFVLASGFAQNRQRPELPPKTHANVSYGDHPQHLIDFWRADVGGRAPLAVYVHGGGFTGGSKDRVNVATVRKLLAHGIHVASIEYRFLKHAQLPAAHEDVARAIQFIRSKGREWGIHTDRIGGFGGSAGAQLVAYLAFHDDMADPDSEDPIARQSTRLACVAPNGCQSMMDLNWWKKNIPGYDDYHTDPNKYFRGGPEMREAYAQQYSVYNLISPDDPPVYLTYGMAPDSSPPEDPKKLQGWKVHHVNFGIHMMGALRTAGVEAVLDYPGPETPYGSTVDFLIAKLAWKGQRSLYERYEPGTFRAKSGESIDYQLMKPRNYDPKKRYPLVVFLHGSGGRGPANIRNLVDADTPAQLATDAVSGKREAFYLVPQAQAPNTWGKTVEGMERRNDRISKQDAMLELVDDLIAKRNIDKRRLYITGLSMGGMGTYSAVSERPRFWAAAAPVCGRWTPEDANSFLDMPMWLFHGDLDTSVEVQYSRDMHAAIKAKGGDIRYTEYPGVKHNSWLNAYWEDELWEWMFAQRR